MGHVSLPEGNVSEVSFLFPFCDAFFFVEICGPSETKRQSSWLGISHDLRLV